MSNVVIGDKEFFPEIKAIKFEGKESKNPLCYRYYDKDRIVLGKPMKEHLKFAVCYWHTFCTTGADPFGVPTHHFPWNNTSNGDAITLAKLKMDAAFEFITKLSLDYYCFHDVDIAPSADNLTTNWRYLEQMANYAKQKQQDSHVQLLWGTANLFSHARYMNGAMTNPDFKVLNHAIAQIKQAMDVTIMLGGKNYVFWGGREGYNSLLNTNMSLELDNMAKVLTMMRDYARAQGFKGTFFIEPKPHEPCKHQYDFDAATTIGFLKHYGLEKDFKLNIEVNHATLAGHTFAHELQVAVNNGMLGSIDANRGDYQNGWDTDQFPLNIYEIVEALLVILGNGDGAIDCGGINFDAKIRRNSTDLVDLFIAHISGIDTFARALLVAADLLEHSAYKELRKKRYQSFTSGDGLLFRNNQLDVASLYQLALNNEATIKPISGKQELYEQLINLYL